MRLYGSFLVTILPTHFDLQIPKTRGRVSYISLDVAPIGNQA